MCIVVYSLKYGHCASGQVRTIARPKLSQPQHSYVASREFTILLILSSTSSAPLLKAILTSYVGPIRVGPLLKMPNVYGRYSFPVSCESFDLEFTGHPLQILPLVLARLISRTNSPDRRKSREHSRRIIRDLYGHATVIE